MARGQCESWASWQNCHLTMGEHILHFLYMYFLYFANLIFLNYEYLYYCYIIITIIIYCKKKKVM